LGSISFSACVNEKKLFASSYLLFFLENFASEYLVCLLLVLTKEMRTSGALFFLSVGSYTQLFWFLLLQRSCVFSILILQRFLLSTLGQKQHPNELGRLLDGIRAGKSGDEHRNGLVECAGRSSLESFQSSGRILSQAISSSTPFSLLLDNVVIQKINEKAKPLPRRKASCATSCLKPTKLYRQSRVQPYTTVVGEL
jgi:hypothetical protein